jgi:hypothetical protein
MAQVVKYLSSKHEALSSNPIDNKNPNKNDIAILKKNQSGTQESKRTKLALITQCVGPIP